MNLKFNYNKIVKLFKGMTKKGKIVVVSISSAAVLVTSGAIIIGNMSKGNNSPVDFQKVYTVNLSSDFELLNENGEEINIDIRENSTPIALITQKKISKKKMYDVIVIDNDGKLQAGKLLGKYISSNIHDEKDINFDIFKIQARVIADCGAWFRQEPKINNESTEDMVLPYNTEIIVNDDYNTENNGYNWKQVLYINNNSIEIGYMAEDFIQAKAETVRPYEPIETENNITVKKNIGPIKFRETPDADSNNVIKTLDANTFLYIENEQLNKVSSLPFASDHYWVKAKLATGEEGYVAYDLIYDICTAPAGIAMDAEIGEIIYEKDINTLYEPASITKVLTVYLAHKYGNLNDMLTYTEKVVDLTKSGFAMGGYSSFAPEVVSVGNKISLNDALYLSMMYSDNPTTYLIGKYLEGLDMFKNMSIDEILNSEAKKLGCETINFTNAFGYEDPTHLISAKDYATMMMNIIKDDKDVLAIMNTMERNLNYITNQGEIKTYYCVNFMANYKTLDNRVAGLKSGNTDCAGCTLVTIFEENNKKIITVILKGKSFGEDFIDSQAMANIAFEKINSQNYGNILENNVNYSFGLSYNTDENPKTLK